MSTPFFGRAEELAEIRSLLEHEPGCRLLTLVGPSGIGKTRLAIEAAHPMQFVDGIWFVSLASIDSGASLAYTIAVGLQLQLHGFADVTEQLVSHLRERELLLVLDNFEHQNSLELGRC